MRVILGLISVVGLITVSCTPFKSNFKSKLNSNELESEAGWPPGGPPTIQNCNDSPVVIKSGLRRLTASEIKNSIRDLLGVTDLDENMLPQEGRNSLNFQNDATFQNLYSGEGEKLMNLTLASVQSAINSGTVQSCQPGEELSEIQCLRQIATRLAERAWRRKIEKPDIDNVLKLTEELETYSDKLEVVVGAIMLSPNFLLIGSRDLAQSTSTHTLNSYQRAELLALFLWRSVPDQMLINDARSGALNRMITLKSHIERMIDDPKANAAIDEFVENWFELSKLENKTRDPELFPQFNDQIKSDMEQESKEFIRHIIRQRRPLSEILTANYSILNSRLAEYYGVSPQRGPATGWTLTPMPEYRSGILSHAGVLISTSSGIGIDTSAIKRGRYAVQKITCTDPGPPPAQLPDNPEAEEQIRNAQTVKQQLAIHRTRTDCAYCHRHIDPVGISLEVFDNAGQFRTLYPNGAIVDASSEFESIPFDGPRGLAQSILATDHFERCFIEGIGSFALNRVASTLEDKCYQNEIATKMKQGNWNFIQLVQEMVTSDWLLKYRNL